MRFDLIVNNAIIVTMEPSCAPFRGWIGCKDGRIKSVCAGAPACTDAAEIIDAKNKILMPGLINGHCHGDMTVLRGAGDGLTLQEQNSVFEDSCWFGTDLTEDDLFISRQLTYLEAIASGTTFIMENMYWGIGIRAVQAMRETGIRGALSEEYRTSRNLDPAGGHLTDAYLEEFAGECRRHDIVPVLSSVAEEGFSEPYLKSVYGAAAKAGMLVTQHVAETPWRMELIRERYGMSPVRYMDSIGVLDMAPVIASHSVHVSKEDRDIMLRKGVRVVNTPVCEMKIADGVAPLKEYLEEGVPVGLGTDGAMWDNTNDMFGEIKYSVLLQSVTKGVRSVSARQAVEMATIRGAEVFGLQEEMGSIREGKSADFILVDTAGLHMQPLRTEVHENILSAIAFCACGRDVTDTFIRGKGVMRDRKILSMDVDRVLSEAKSISDRVLSGYGEFHA